MGVENPKSVLDTFRISAISSRGGISWAYHKYYLPGKIGTKKLETKVGQILQGLEILESPTGILLIVNVSEVWEVGIEVLRKRWIPYTG